MSSAVFNPAFLSAEDLIRGFVVRQSELAAIVRVVEVNTGPSLQHLLVLGGRGLGKSTLVRRVVAEIQRRPDLDARWYPVVFPEEAYEVRDIGEFWLEALLRLADQTGDRRWVELHGRLRSERDPARLERAARGALEAHAQELGRRILLVVENLDMLMGQISEQDAWALRKVLQDAPTFMLLATAVRKFEALTDHRAPFYEGLRRMELQPLTVSEIEDVWASVAGYLPPRPRTQALRVLTGGNPRMVILLARFVDGQSLHGLLDELSGLIDLHTDYFKGSIEALDGQNQRVFLALANLWHPATAGVVAEESRLDSNTTSTVLARLEKQGRVEVVGKKGKNKLYQLTERLYNIYYLMRRRGGVDARIKAIIEFMTLLYEPAEMGSLAGRLVGESEMDEGAREACRQVLDGLLRTHRNKPEARAGLLGAISSELLEELDPEEIKRARRTPEELLILLERDDGAKWLPDAHLTLTKSFLKFSVTIQQIAEHVTVHSGLQKTPNWLQALDWIAKWCPDHLIDVLAKLEPNHQGRRTLISRGVSKAIRDVNPSSLRAWRVLLEPDLPMSLAGVLRAHIDLALDPYNETAAVHAFSNLQSTDGPFIEGVMERLIHHKSSKNLRLLSNALAIQLSDEPWAIAARVHAELRLGNITEARQVTAALFRTEIALEYSELACALVEICAGDLKAAHKHVLRSIKAYPVPRAATLFAIISEIQGNTSEAIRAAKMLTFVSPETVAAWSILARLEPDLAIKAWKTEKNTTHQTTILAFARGVILGTDRRLWETAAKALSEFNRPEPAILVEQVRLEGILGRPEHALTAFEQLVRRTDGRKHVLPLALSLAASGRESEVAAALAQAPEPEVFRPLILALGGSVEPAPSAEETALTVDVSERIDVLRRSDHIWRAEYTAPSLLDLFPPLYGFVVKPMPPTKPTKTSGTQKTRRSKLGSTPTVAK